MKQEKILVPGIAVRVFPLIDPVSVDDDHAFLGLPEDFRQLRTVNIFAVDDIPQYVSSPYRRQLIRIPYDDKSGSRSDRTDQPVHQKQDYHRRFIHNDRIVFQRVFFRPAKSHAIFAFRKIVF